MCAPAVIPLVLKVVVAAATVYSAYSSIQAGKTEAKFAEYQAKQTEADANAEKGAAMVEAERIRQIGKRQRSAAIAQLAGSGVDVDEGSAIVIQKDITKNADQDARTAILGGNDRALRLNAQAQVDRARGTMATQAGYATAVGTLAQGAQTLASGWKSKAVTVTGKA